MIKIFFKKYFIPKNFHEIKFFTIFTNFGQIHENLCRETRKLFHSKIFIQQKSFEIVIRKNLSCRSFLFHFLIILIILSFQPFYRHFN